MIAYAATTRDITVTIHPIYLDEPSDFFEKEFAFAYSVRIENRSAEEVQLLRRHWIITEENGYLQDVEGEGVVGQQPVIAPGRMHQYSSSCIINSFGGTMEGTYLMQRESGERFRATIPRFPLHVAAN
jgi:ApaG protein